MRATTPQQNAIHGMTAELEHWNELQETIAAAPAGHNPLACEVLREAEAELMASAEVFLHVDGCLAMQAIGAMGAAHAPLSRAQGLCVDDEDSQRIYDASGGLPWAAIALWNEHEAASEVGAA